MSYLLSTLVFLLIFSLLILIHEFGHFFAARKSGVKVEEFGLGLPPRAKTLWKDKWGTIYSLNWIPFGGFVRMYGEDSVSSEMEHREGSFPSKSIGQRTIIILGGVIMNFLLGYVILVGLFTHGTKPIILSQEDFDQYRTQGLIEAVDHVMVVEVVKGATADNLGVKKGDFIKSADRQIILKSADLVNHEKTRAGGETTLEIERDKVTTTITLPVSIEGRVGIVIAEAPEILATHDISYPFSQAIVKGLQESGRLSLLTMKMFIKVIFDLVTKFQLSPQVSGPVGIARITHETTQTGSIAEILKLIALLSLSLGAINVLPIPALDGGRFLSIGFELITGRRPNAHWEARIHAFGFILLLLLIFVVTYNDIVKLFVGN